MDSVAVETAHVVVTNLTSSASNATTSFFSLPSARSATLIPLRLLAKTDRFLFRTFPGFLARTTGLDVVVNNLFGAGEVAGGAAAEGLPQAAAELTTSWTDILFEAFQASTNRSYWGMLHYVTSRWAFTCFMLALILNRVSVYGASRQRILLTWNKRLALRFIPIMLFLTQMRQLTQAIRCQTSPDFSLYRWGDNNKYSILDWSSDGGPLHAMSSAATFWLTDEQACAAVGMSRPEPNVRAPSGSFRLLWPTFLKLSLSHFVENLSCSLQQVPAMTEIGLSVFEHSLAFAEAESMVHHTLTKKANSKPANSTIAATSNTTTTYSEGTIPASGTILAITDAIQAFFGPHIFDKINVPVEVLLIAFISCGNAVTSHIISVLGKKHKWRLTNTAFWGMCYMTAFTWGFFTESEMVRVDNGVAKPVSGLLHFPTVAIVGFLPHIAIVLGIIVCGAIYLVALLLTAVSLGTNPSIRRPTSLTERIAIAHDNLQAAIQLKSITIRWYEDFYTSLLRIGFGALTAASEAVFLNEGRAVEMRQFTWLEEERLDELDSSGFDRSTDEAHFQIVEEYGIPNRRPGDTSRQAGEWKSGYDKERKLEKKDKTLQTKDAFVYPNPRTDGVGALQRTSRFYLLFIFMRGILFTIGGWAAFGIGSILDRMGITQRPQWLRKVVGASLKQVANDRDRLHIEEEKRSFAEWRRQQSLEPTTRDENIDIEHEMQEKIEREQHDNPREVLDQRMYDWWKDGGWYGNKDESGDFVMPSIEHDEDATSVISNITAATDTDVWESEPEGARTPTQRYSTPSWSFSSLRQRRSATPTPEDPLLDNAYLARLLNPQDRETREQARILSSHLTSDGGIMTRSRYRRQFQNEQAELLLSGRPSSRAPKQLIATAPSSARPLIADDERHALEHLLLTRRRQKQRQADQRDEGPEQNAASGTSTMSGPPCVVCQSEPRTIIAWPCRCLTVCEDCRVNLAMNNFGNCVTCRRSVGGFVRLYVP